MSILLPACNPHATYAIPTNIRCSEHAVLGRFIRPTASTVSLGSWGLLCALWSLFQPLCVSQVLSTGPGSFKWLRPSLVVSAFRVLDRSSRCPRPLPLSSLSSGGPPVAWPTPFAEVSAQSRLHYLIEDSEDKCAVNLSAAPNPASAPLSSSACSKARSHQKAYTLAPCRRLPAV